MIQSRYIRPFCDCCVVQSLILKEYSPRRGMTGKGFNDEVQRGQMAGRKQKNERQKVREAHDAGQIRIER